MKRVSKDEFVAFIKGMEHVGFSSPMPWYGFTDRREYYEGEAGKAEVHVEEDGSERYFIEDNHESA